MNDYLIMTNLLPYWVTALLYLALGIQFWRALPETTPPAAARSATAPLHLAVVVPLLLHAWLLARSMLTVGGFNLALGDTISAIMWLTVFIYWLANFSNQMEGLQAIVFPVAALGVLMPLLLPHTHMIAYNQPPLLKLHLVIAILAYSLFTIAALHAVLMAAAEWHLHGRPLPRPLQNLPPLLTMERLLFRILVLGFILLTITVASGMLFSEQLFGKPLEFNHKVVFAIASWAIFAALLVGRFVYGWRGRTAIRFTLAGSALLLLAYVGTRFVLEVILHRY